MLRLSGRGRGRRLGWTWRRLAALIIAVVLVVPAACSSPGPRRAAAPPHTPAGTQLRWLLATLDDLPLSEQQARAHLNSEYLTMMTPTTLNQWLQAVTQWLHTDRGVTLRSVRVDTRSMVAGIVSTRADGPRARIGVTVDSRGLIADVDIGPTIAGPVPSTWAGVDAALRSVAPEVRLLVADVSNGSCQPIHNIDPHRPAPFGSVLKLYVLGALGRAVAAGNVDWDQPLRITSESKSLPSGVLQYEPDGTRITVREAAAKMIAISDNTATDMLIKLVGRSAVEATMVSTGMDNPDLNRPFLTTRETFVLTLEQWPRLARRYLTAGDTGRRELLTTVDQLPLPKVAAMRLLEQRGFTGLGWIASASDICRAYVSLTALSRRPGLSPIAQVLSLDEDILELDPAQWKTTWRKGGVGPGATAMSYLATTRTGHTYVVNVLTEDRYRRLDPATAGPIILSAMKGAFILAARG